MFQSGKMSFRLDTPMIPEFVFFLKMFKSSIIFINHFQAPKVHGIWDAEGAWFALYAMKDWPFV